MRSAPARGAWRAATALAAALTAAPPAPAQRVSAAEVSAGAVVVAARQSFVGVALGAAYRPGGQTRLALTMAPGIEAQRAALRAQITAQFLVTPTARRGLGVYGGMGLAVRARRGRPGAAYVALLLGIEQAPGRAGGGYGEVGLSGGVRVSAGWRWRNFPPWWAGRGP